MTRRTLFRRLLIGAAVPSYAFAVEPGWLDLTNHDVPVRGELDGPVRILHLSDFHVSNVVPFSLIERAVDMGLATRPHVVCITGDFVTSRESFDRERYCRILKKLSARAPVFASLGNHDGGPWAATHIGGLPDSSLVRGILAESGVQLLHNRAETIRVSGSRIRFAGVGDLWNEEVDPVTAFAGAGRDASSPTVLLAHNPDTKETVAEQPWDVMLCGHTHGGQVLVPGIGPRFVAVRDKNFISGLKHWSGRYIYISRGVGNLAGVRLNCRPEVTALRLVKSPLDAKHTV